MSEFSPQVTEKLDALTTEVVREFLAKFDKQLEAQAQKAMSASNTSAGGALVSENPDDEEKEETQKVSPNAGEDRADFISRCAKELADEFPDNDQRIAACHSMWGKSQKRMLEKCFEVSMTDLDDSALEVVKQIADAVVDLPVADAEFGHAYYSPEKQSVHVVLSAADEKPVYETWGAAIEKIGAVKEITGAPESMPTDPGWIRIDKSSAESETVVVDLPKYSPVNVISKIQKIEDDKDYTFCYGLVLEAGRVDKQGDVMSAEEIERTSDDFMEHSQTIGFMHHTELKKSAAVPVRSHVLDRDMTFGNETYAAGSWMLGVRIYADTLRKKVLSGELTGFSIGGRGVRTPMLD